MPSQYSAQSSGETVGVVARAPKVVEAEESGNERDGRLAHGDCRCHGGPGSPFRYAGVTAINWRVKASLRLCRSDDAARRLAAMAGELEWAKLGESERQLRDVRALLETKGESLEMAYVERWPDELDVRELWGAGTAMSTIVLVARYVVDASD